MTAVWILLFVCTSSLPSCSQGDVSVANQSYTSSEECYADWSGASVKLQSQFRLRPFGVETASPHGQAVPSLILLKDSLEGPEPRPGVSLSLLK